MTGALLAFLFSLDDATVAAFLTGPRFVTLPVRIMTYMEFAFDPTLAAISTVLIVLSLVAIILLDRLVGLSMFLDTSKTS
jgi:putative spermidine/putrescine transport system permease protein